MEEAKEAVKHQERERESVREKERERRRNISPEKINRNSLDFNTARNSFEKAANSSNLCSTLDRTRPTILNTSNRFALLTSPIKKTFVNNIDSESDPDDPEEGDSSSASNISHTSKSSKKYTPVAGHTRSKR